MKLIKIKAYAKINLTLEVEGKRPDGYHTLNTVMQAVSLYDHIKIAVREESGIGLRCNLPYVPCDGRNIVYKAAVQFYSAIGKMAYGLEIEIDKRIPVGAGLAGGSADCGAVLIALNQLEGSPLTMQQLMELGATLGSDVPFTMLGGCAVAYGLGYDLTPIKPMPSCHIVLCKPRFSVSTKAAFEALTPANYSTENRSAHMVQLLEQGDLSAIAGGLYNSFEQPVAGTRPLIHTIKAKLTDCGAVGTLMSGSGSTVYGIFTSSKRAYAAQRVLRKLCQEVYVARPMKKE